MTGISEIRSTLVEKSTFKEYEGHDFTLLFEASRINFTQSNTSVDLNIPYELINGVSLRRSPAGADYGEYWVFSLSLKEDGYFAIWVHPDSKEAFAEHLHRYGMPYVEEFVPDGYTYEN